MPEISSEPPRMALYDAWLMRAEFEHRVANEYAMVIATISLAATGSTSPEARKTLLETARRVGDYADLHRALQAPAGSGVADLAEYLRVLCATLARAMLEERGIRLTLIERSIDLEAARCWRATVIINELITNAIKHGLKGHGGSIFVELSAERDMIECRVSDNGIPAAQPAAGRGTAVMDALARELDGRVVRQPSERGTTAILEFPVGDSRRQIRSMGAA
jgi:two-component sensor histidine kinase